MTGYPASLVIQPVPPVPIVMFALRTFFPAFFRTFCHSLTAAAALSGALAAQAADPLRIDTGSALTVLVKHFRWLEAAGVKVEWVAPGQQADFAVAAGTAALAARAGGTAVKAVDVLSRPAEGSPGRTTGGVTGGSGGDAADTQFLLAPETLLAARGAEARVVLVALERARQWVNAQPDAAARIIGAALPGRSFSGSRPGPAQLAALKALARERGVDEQLGAALLDDSAYRAALNAMQTAALSR